MASVTAEAQKMRRGSVGPVGALLVATLLLGGCSHKDAVVTATRAELQPITRTVSANGKVELTQDFQAHAVGAGQVKQLLVKVGDIVVPGQLLIRLDDSDARLRLQNADVAIASAQIGASNLAAGGNAEDLLNAKADMTSAQVTLQQARTRLATLQQLGGQGNASANEIALAETQVTEAQNRVNALQARQGGRYSSADLALQRRQITRSHAEAAAAQSNLANSDIRAPFGGTVYAVPVIPYANVNPGEDLVNVADLSKIRVRAFFDEPEIGRLAIGQAVRFVWDAKPDREWHGHISQTPMNVTSYGTRNVGECLITVDDPGGLIPNVNVTLYVTTLHRDNVLSIPHEGLRTEGKESYVYRIVDNKLVKTPVQVGVVTPTRAQIVSGLNPGDTVMLVPLNDVEIKDGVPVRIQP